MLNFQKRKKIEGLLYSPWMLVLMVLLTGFFIYKLAGIVIKSNETNAQKKESLADLNKSQNQKASLIEALEDLETQWGSERAVVDKFRVVKEGEGLIVILNPDKNVENEKNHSKDNSLWNSFRNLFK
ncbi:hypothetical protein A3I25_00570 [Candidatus Nomurabacteria bacterium RIFCSPLOWO2_02_FULL_42_17]|uniref:Septum formation initiator n=1 Tax=Candidatus Nomurabacteria bacterium RIFCSPLOWO2_02_FULL_42_17 TaxID=1801789 RepID=A0A1F6XPU8_9BACT|nr:MAG: hypothetical protein A3I25_00570 [Candidatus Nomurabacteria bacterium RIFCSPLOWO2_02_FULL_42_17]